MAKVKFKRVLTNSDVDDLDFDDGSFIVTAEGKSYIDYGDSRIAIGGTPDTEMSDISTNTVENNVIKSYVDTSFQAKGKILWTNPNPNDVISDSTTITFSSSDYDIIEIFYKTANDGDDLESTKTIKGYGVNLSATGYQGAGLRRRITYNSDTSYTIQVYNGETLSDSATGKYIIPVYIIGYETGLFS